MEPNSSSKTKDDQEGYSKLYEDTNELPKNDASNEVPNFASLATESNKDSTIQYSGLHVIKAAEDVEISPP